MAKTKAKVRAHAGANVWDSGRGYNGVKRAGSGYAWEYNGAKLGRMTKGGFDTAEEAAYAYDEFIITHIGPDADTNQSLGYLKERTVLAIREKINKAEKHTPKRNMHPIGKSGYKGVSSNPKSKKNPYMSYAMVRGKQIYVGSFPTAEDAARAYDMYVIKHLGSSAQTNAGMGLLPPVGEIKFVPGRSSPPSNNHCTKSDQPAASNAASMLQILTPEQERLAQIEAARLMAADEIDEEEMPPVIETPVAPCASLIPSPEGLQPDSALLQTQPDLQPVNINSARADITTPAASQSPISELMPLAGVSSMGDELRARAALLLKQAGEADELAVRHNMIAKVSGMSESVQGFQKAVYNLLDYGAELEKQISELTAMLKK